VDLYLLRHGRAGTRGSEGQQDSGRPLTPEGRKEVTAIAGWLAGRGIPFSLVATSPILRARETAEIVHRALEPRPELVVWDELIPGGEMDDLVIRIARSDTPDALLLVGHEPLLSTLASRIIAGDERARMALARGGLAKIRNIGFRNGITGELHWLLTSRQIRAMR
jgi:phosphohistidine phosphatase